MNKRLKLIADLITDSFGVIDVGTDHGYLPISLRKNGFIGKLIASDINKEPLSVARENAFDYGCTDIDFQLSDGLDSCDPNEIDTIVIAGLGGDLICEILDRAEWTMDSRFHIIAQPMTKAEILRFWLVNNGYFIENEYPVNDRGREYSILSIRYRGLNQKYSDAELFIGKNPSKGFINKTIRMLSKKPYSPFYETIINDLRLRTNDIR